MINPILSTSNYANFFECIFCFNFKKTWEHNLQLTFLVLPNSTSQIFFLIGKILILSYFKCFLFYFLLFNFSFHDFFTFHKFTLFMLTYTTWVYQDRKQSTGLGCLPHPTNISTAKNRTVVSMDIVFPELVSQ